MSQEDTSPCLSTAGEAATIERDHSSSSFMTPEEEEAAGQSSHASSYHLQQTEVAQQQDWQTQTRIVSLETATGEGGSGTGPEREQQQPELTSYESSSASKIVKSCTAQSLDPKCISTADVDPDFVLDYRPETVEIPESPRLLSPSKLYLNRQQQVRKSQTR